MRRLIGYEFGKICRKKMVYAALLYLVWFAWFNSQVFGMPAEQVTTTEGDTLRGREAVRYMQEFDRKYQGELTDEKVEEIFMRSYPEDVIEETGGFSYMHCPDILMYLDGRFFPGEKTKVADVFTPEMGEIRFGYHGSFSKLLFCTIMQMWEVGFVIIIAVTPVFADEYSKGTDALILTAKYGKSAGVTAKVTAAFLFSLLLCLADIAVNVFLFLTGYGTEGWNTSVQVDFMKRNWTIPYEMNYGQLMGYAVLAWLAAGVLLTGMALLVSAYCHTAFGAVILASFCYVMPAFLQISGWYKVLFPIYQAAPQNALCMRESGYLSVGGWKIMPFWLVAAFSIAAAAGLGIWAKRRFAGWQVSG